MVPYLGDFAEDDTVYIMFNTFDSNDPSASVTMTNFVNTDVHIHKDDGLTQRNNAAGITVSVDFDGITGSHMIKIDTSDDTVAGFWVTGSEYFVRIEGTTIDAATVNAVVAHFSIERAGGVIALLKLIQAAVITNAAGADVAADIIAVKADTAATLSDTGTDGVVVASGSKTGYALSTAGNQAIWDLASAVTLDFGTLLERCYQALSNKQNITNLTGAVDLRAIGDGSSLATWTISDDDTTTVKTEASW